MGAPTNQPNQLFAFLRSFVPRYRPQNIREESARGPLKTTTAQIVKGNNICSLFDDLTERSEAKLEIIDREGVLGDSESGKFCDIVNS